MPAYEMLISSCSSYVCSSDLAGIQIDVAGSEPHRQAIADHQEQFVLMLVVVPVELAGEFRELHEGVIEFARDLRAPVIAEATERLAKIAFVHVGRSEEHTSELQSLMRISYAVFCLKKNKLTY